jgi:hypothetical protein
MIEGAGWPPAGGRLALFFLGFEDHSRSDIIPIE